MTTFANGFSYAIENDGYSKIYVPRENGEVFPVNTRLERHMKTFKSESRCIAFLVKQGAIIATK